VTAALVSGVAGASAAPRGGIVFVPSSALSRMSERVAARTSPDGRRLYFLGGLDARTGVAIVQRDPVDGRL
jgi:hypothetical protein